MRIGKWTVRVEGWKLVLGTETIAGALGNELVTVASVPIYLSNPFRKLVMAERTYKMMTEADIQWLRDIGVEPWRL